MRHPTLCRIFPTVCRNVWLLPLITLFAVGVSLSAQSDYDSRALKMKSVFAEREIKSLAEPYVGVTTSEGKVAGLFPIKSTGVSTVPMVEAANAFLAALSPNQQLRTVFSVEDPEWRRWCNVDNGIYVRQGVSLQEMDAPQRVAARNLMRATLSAKGLALADAIRKTDETLRELNSDNLSYGEELYFFTVMGLPSPTEPWGWQIDGHHLIINAFVLGDQVVMTPTFLGGEPVHTTTGKHAGNVILQDEQNQGLTLMRALKPDQQAAATLSPTKTRNSIQAEAFKDNAVVNYAGVSAATFSSAQKSQLKELVALFVNNQSEGQARVRMEKVTAHLDETWFAWVGGTAEDSVFYYRIHSPVVLIEFDHQMPVGTRMINPSGKVTRDHIHVIIRTPNGNDYGRDLLRQHLESHPH